MSDDRSQGRKANDAGDSARATVRGHLVTHAGLTISQALTMAAYEAEAMGYMGTGRGDFCEDVRVIDCGVYNRPFLAHYAIRRRGWPHPLLLFVHSQNDSGTAENAALRFLLNLFHQKRRPGVILLLGDHWEHPADDGAAVDYVRSWQRKQPPLLLRVFVGLAEFRAWIAEGMPWPEAPQKTFA